MSKFLNVPVIGIDVSADFSFVAILAPNGAVYRKSFKINHDAEGFDYFIKETKKSGRRVLHETCTFHGIYWCIPPNSFPLPENE